MLLLWHTNGSQFNHLRWQQISIVLCRIFDSWLFFSFTFLLLYFFAFKLYSVHLNRFNWNYMVRFPIHSNNLWNVAEWSLSLFCYSKPINVFICKHKGIQRSAQKRALARLHNKSKAYVLSIIYTIIIIFVWT